ncbi:MAG: WD40 repeat domain-containing protein [Kofleriaceae bacterium]|nr:WD40 repeat domain-containing protein [Kofleriaceae bacterium]
MIQNPARFSIELPCGDAPTVIRQAVIASDTLFMLVTDHADYGGLCCAVLAFDLRLGAWIGRETTGYIKFDNGGGTLSVSPDGRHVAVGAEFSVSVYDHTAGSLVWSVNLDDDDDQTSRPGVFVDADRIVRIIEDHLMLVDLRSGEVSHGQVDPRLAAADLVVEPGGTHLLCGSTNNLLHRVRVEDGLSIESSHPHKTSRLGDPIVDRWGRVYFLGSGLVQLDLASGVERVVMADRVPTPLAIRLEPHRATIVHALGVLSIDLDRAVTARHTFDNPILGAACGDDGRFWLISANVIECMPESLEPALDDHVSVSCRPHRY